MKKMQKMPVGKVRKTQQTHIVVFLQNATIEYSSESIEYSSESALVCLCFCTMTQKEIDLGTSNLNILYYMKI